MIGVNTLGIMLMELRHQLNDHLSEKFVILTEESKMLTDDPTDPRLGHGADTKPVPQNDVYLVLSQAEIAKGYTRPLRRSYKHVGPQPKNPLRELTEDEHTRFDAYGYVVFEVYPNTKYETGRFWTQAQLDSKGCGLITTMGLTLCETYARDPGFYGSTYCTYCQMHRPVEEFVWNEDGAVVGS